MVNTSSFTRHIDSGRLCQAKICKVFREILRAHSLSDIDERRIAGIHHSMRQILRSMAGVVPGPVPAVILCAVDGHIAQAIKARLRRHSAAFQSSGRRYNLKDRARLIWIGNRIVAPQRVKRLHPGLLACLLRFLRVVLRQSGQLLLKLFSDVFVDDVIRVVWIEIRLGGHRQHRACLWIHHDAGHTVAHTMLGQRNLKVLFKVMLNCLVDRQHKRIAILRFIPLDILHIHINARAVFHRHNASRRPGERLFIIRLKSIRTVVVIVGKTQHSRSEIPVWIITAGVLLEENNARQSVFADRCHQRVCLVVLDLLLDNLVIGTFALQLLFDSFLIRPDIFRQQIDDGLLFFGRISQFWRNADRRNVGADSELFAVCVVDDAAFGADARCAQLMLERARLHRLALHNLEHKQLMQHDTETEHDHRDKHDDHTAFHMVGWRLRHSFIPFLCKSCAVRRMDTDTKRGVYRRIRAKMRGKQEA